MLASISDFRYEDVLLDTEMRIIDRVVGRGELGRWLGTQKP